MPSDSNTINNFTKGLMDSADFKNLTKGAEGINFSTTSTDAMAKLDPLRKKADDLENGVLKYLEELMGELQGSLDSLPRPGSQISLNNGQPGNTQPAGDGVEKDDVENPYVKFHAEGPRGSNYRYWVSPSNDPKDRQDRDFKFDRDGYKVEGRVRGGGKLHFGFWAPGKNANDKPLYDLWF